MQNIEKPNLGSIMVSINLYVFLGFLYIFLGFVFEKIHTGQIVRLTKLMVWVMLVYPRFLERAHDAAKIGFFYILHMFLYVFVIFCIFLICFLT